MKDGVDLVEQRHADTTRLRGTVHAGGVHHAFGNHAQELLGIGDPFTLGVASGNLSDLFNSSSKVWQYGGSLGLPIFTAGLLAGQVQVAEAQQQQALFAYQKAVQDAFRGVNDALIDQDRTRVQLAAQRQQVDSLTRYADTAQLRYDNGYTSYLEVVDAQRSLFNAQLSYTQTQQTLLQASINLYKAMGGGWVAASEQAGSAPSVVK